MLTKPPAQQDRAPDLVPAVSPTAPWSVKQAEALDGYRIHVIFTDGVTGTVDLSRLVLSERAGVFAALRDPDIFARVSVEYGAVTWPDGIDLAPDAMYDSIAESGHWIPE